MNYFFGFGIVIADEEILSIKEKSKTSECISDGKQDPIVWKWC